MKPYTQLLAAALAALTIGSAKAETIYITGATAFRAIANNVIDQYAISTQGGNTNAARVAFDTNNLSKAINAVWKLGNGDYISAYWAGGQAAIQSVTGPTQVITTNKVTYSTNFVTNATKPVDTPAYTKVSGTGVTNTAVWKQVVSATNLVTLQTPNALPFWNPTVIAAAAGSVPVATNATAAITNVPAVIGIGDTYQRSSPFAAGNTVGYYTTNNYYDPSTGFARTNLTALATNTYTAAVSDTNVAVISYAWFVATNSPIYNLTPAQAKKLLTNGVINAYELTQQLSDTNAGVYTVGRNLDSGARAQILINAGLGSVLTSTGVTKGIKQFAVLKPGATINYSDGNLYLSNSSTTNLLVAPWPAEVIDGKVTQRGAGGYSSGSLVAAAVTLPNSSNNILPNGINTNLPGTSYLVGYSGASEAVSGGAKILQWNGVPLTLETVKSGAYTLWSYVHVLVGSGASSTAQTFANTLADNIKSKSTSYLNNLNYGTIALSDLTNSVSRADGVDGGTVSKIWTNAYSNGIANPTNGLFGY
jgi:hypothetical protein